MRFPPSAILPAAAVCLLTSGGSGLAFPIQRPSFGHRHKTAAARKCAPLHTAAGGGGKHAAAAASVDSARTSSFEEAQSIGAELAAILTASCASGESMPEEAQTLLRALVSTTSGARGWFVSLLTDPAFGPVFDRPVDETFLAALCESPDPNVKLMTMNVAMSTATELTHLSMGNPDLAASSRMTAERASVLALELMERLPGLRDSFVGLRSAVDGGAEGDKEWLKFCKKWGYGQEQRDAIRIQVDRLLENKC